MKIIIFISVAFAVVYLNGCTTKKALEKPAYKKVLPIKKEIHDTNKVYKQVIESNVARKKNIDNAEKKYDERKSQLLKQLQGVRDKLSKDKNGTKYLKEKEKILEELQLAEKELEKVKQKNKIVNFTAQKQEKQTK